MSLPDGVEHSSLYDDIYVSDKLRWVRWRLRQRFGFMIIAANSTNTAYRPGFNYTGFSGAQFSWSQNCSGTGNNSCLAIDEALVSLTCMA